MADTIRLESPHKKGVYAVVVGTWTRPLHRAYYEAVASEVAALAVLEANKSLPPDQQIPTEPPHFLRDYYKRIVLEICLIDEDGNKYTDIDKIFELDFDQIPFDRRVEGFFEGIPDHAINFTYNEGKKNYQTSRTT